jgi:hypothetical protein
VTTAIVIITCPSCGGEIEGVQTTSVEQTIRCRFCRTELHVPRVGEVVRERVVEVVREVPAEPTYVPNADLRRRTSLTWRLGMLGVVVLSIIPIMCWVKHDADRTSEEFKRQDEARARCESDCKSSCVHAGDHETSMGDPAFDSQMRDADRVVCESECEQTRDCWGTR